MKFNLYETDKARKKGTNIIGTLIDYEFNEKTGKHLYVLEESEMNDEGTFALHDLLENEIEMIEDSTNK